DFGHNELGAGLLDEAIMSRVLASHEKKEDLEALFVQYPWVQAQCELGCRKVKEMYFSKEEKWIDEPASNTVRIRTEKPIHFDVEVMRQDMEDVLRTPLSALDNRNWVDAFRNALGFAKEKTKDNPPRLILLTGGASRMGFTLKLCEDVFPDARVLRSAEPEFTIAKGLAWAGRVDIKSRAFRDEVEGLLDSGKIQETVKKNRPPLLSSLAEVLSEKMPDQFVLPAFYDWRDGKIPTLAALEPAVEGRLKDWLESADGKQSLAPSVINWFENLRPEVEKLTNPICDKYHIQRSALGLPSLKTPGG